MTSSSKNILKNTGNDVCDFSEVPLKAFEFPARNEEAKRVLDKTAEKAETVQP